MNIVKAILLGALQGLTEFLPVSSSGHLAIFSRILNTNLETGLYFDILLHLGTLISICLVYYKDIWKMIREFFRMIFSCMMNLVIWIRNIGKEDKEEYLRILSNGYRKLDLMIILSTIPTGILGIVGKDLVAWATKTLWMVGICLILTAGLLLLADRHNDGTINLKRMRFSSAFFIGIAQGIATMPGLSRSGTTICAGMCLGLEKRTAVKYSFLMSLPAVLGAVVLDLKDIKEAGDLVTSEIGCYVAGTVMAAITGYIALRFMLYLVRNKRYRGFSIYCALMGIVAIILSFTGK